MPSPELRAETVSRRLAAAALVAAVLLVLVYVLAVLTGPGQHRDDVAFDGRRTEPQEIRAEADEVLRLVSRSTLPLLGGAVVLVALVRRRWRLAAAAAVVMGGTVVSAEVLKRLLPRPDLLDMESLGFNSWPSGHVAIAASVSLALVMVTAARRRPAAAALGAAFVVAFGLAVVVSGWHRPSDAVGAGLLALAWATGVSAVLVGRRGIGPDDEPGAPVSGRTFLAVGGVLLIVGFVAYAVRVLVDRGHEIGAVERHDALLVALTLVAAVALLTVGAYVRLLRGVGLDPPASPSRPDGPTQARTLD